MRSSKSAAKGQAETDGWGGRNPHESILTVSTESEFKASSTKRAAASISSSVVKRPKLNRIEALLCVSVSPKAPSTWEGVVREKRACVGKMRLVIVLG